MGTEEPTPIRSASEKLMITKGMARFSAAKAVSPRIRPTKIPSRSWYRAEASMLTAPGTAAMKKSFVGETLENRYLESIAYLQIPFFCYFFCSAHFGSVGLPSVFASRSPASKSLSKLSFMFCAKSAYARMKSGPCLSRVR